jgi:hypothetical protein
MTPEIKIAIIASSSAILGAVISQTTTFLISWIERKRQKHILLRQKYEEVMLSFSASLRWLQELNGSTSQEAVFALAQNQEARKMASLCLLYFHEDLGDAAKNYLLSQVSYYQALVSVYDEHNSSCTAGGQFMRKDKKYKEVIDDMFGKKNCLESLLVENSKKYTIA